MDYKRTKAENQKQAGQNRRCKSAQTIGVHTVVGHRRPRLCSQIALLARQYIAFVSSSGEINRSPGPRQAAGKGSISGGNPERYPSGAKAHLYFHLFAARLKSCSKKKQSIPEHTMRVVLSHPCDRKKSQGWGTEQLRPIGLPRKVSCPVGRRSRRRTITSQISEACSSEFQFYAPGLRVSISCW